MIAGRVFSVLLLAGLFCALGVEAGENAAPSSHLVFDDNFQGDIIINEVRVPADGEATYTYYETLGWRGKAAGYAGIQAHPKAHNYIFSIWDHKEHEAPIKALYHGPGTTTEKFGGEGTGLKSWNFELGWKTDTWYTLVARCWAMGERTHHGFWVRSGETGAWTHMVTMEVAAEQAFFLGGTDAFIEDWLETGKNRRVSNLRAGWKRRHDGTSPGAWHPFGSARYSVNAWDLKPGKRSFNFRTNWNGGVAKDDGGDYYFMVAGGKETGAEVENPSTHAIKRDEKKPDFVPLKLTGGKARWTKDGKMVVEWVADSKTLPPFRTAIAIHDDRQGEGKAYATGQWSEPHRRRAEFSLPTSRVTPKPLFALVTCEDLLGNQSAVLVLPVER